MGHGILLKSQAFPLQNARFCSRITHPDAGCSLAAEVAAPFRHD
jgi:hypothetical protein